MMKKLILTLLLVPGYAWSACSNPLTGYTCTFTPTPTGSHTYTPTHTFTHTHTPTRTHTHTHTFTPTFTFTHTPSKQNLYVNENPGDTPTWVPYSYPTPVPEATVQRVSVDNLPTPQFTYTAIPTFVPYPTPNATVLAGKDYQISQQAALSSIDGKVPALSGGAVPVVATLPPYPTAVPLATPRPWPTQAPWPTAVPLATPNGEGTPVQGAWDAMRAMTPTLSVKTFAGGPVTTLAQSTPGYPFASEASVAGVNPAATQIAQLNADAVTVNTGAVAFAATPNIWVSNPPYTSRGIMTSFSASVSTTTPVTFLAATAATFKDITHMTIGNVSGTAVTLTVQSSATTMLGPLVIAANSYLDLKRPLMEITANQPWRMVLGNAVTQVFVSGQAFQNTW